MKKPKSPKKPPNSTLEARAEMLHEVHKASAKGNVRHDDPEDADETPAEELAEHEAFAKGGAVKCMYCGGMNYAKGGHVEGGKAYGNYAKGGKFIDQAIKKPGALHKELGVPEDKKIPAKTLNKAAKAGGKLGERARFAKTLKGFKK